MPKFKTKIHELRKERNIQQAELAELVGVRRETIGKLENGKYNPSLKLALDIAKVLVKQWRKYLFLKTIQKNEKRTTICRGRENYQLGKNIALL